MGNDGAAPCSTGLVSKIPRAYSAHSLPVASIKLLTICATSDNMRIDRRLAAICCASTFLGLRDIFSKIVGQAQIMATSCLVTIFTLSQNDLGHFGTAGQGTPVIIVNRLSTIFRLVEGLREKGLGYLGHAGQRDPWDRWDSGTGRGRTRINSSPLRYDLV